MIKYYFLIRPYYDGIRFSPNKKYVICIDKENIFTTLRRHGHSGYLDKSRKAVLASPKENIVFRSSREAIRNIKMSFKNVKKLKSRNIPNNWLLYTGIK